ncbi:MAG: NAD(+) synthase [Erysipelotrichales bacterium]|nr:NAD(+) synthase [Erysipelotrichales bacterium]
MEKKFGFIRVGAVVPELRISDVTFNVSEIKKMMDEAMNAGVEITLFPELALTGYTCADLFLNEHLLNKSLEGLIELKKYTKKVKGVFIVGLPMKADNQLFNVGAVLENGHILGIVPKTYIPNYGEFYEKRWFSEDNRRISDKLIIDGETIPFKTNMLFQEKGDVRRTFGIEICEDLWCTYPPSNDLTIRGAKMIFNLSASNEIIGKENYRKNLVKSQSEKTISAYIYASAGINESTTDLVFSGASFIYENGKMLAQNERFDFESNLIYNDVDLARIESMRYKDISYMGVIKDKDKVYDTIYFEGYNPENELVRSYEQTPFVPSSQAHRNERCEEILNIQAHALAKRLKATGIKKSVVGISGGLDSTLAFLVVIKAYDILGLDHKDIYGITMPGFGTTNRTYTNACDFVKLYGATLKEINIKDACLQHFKDIDHDPANLDVTYENVQARERTQILMDYANKIGGLVIGTGDLSELALGWCTYNGDHMSMYAVNVSIPKTLVRYLVQYYGETEESEKRRKIIMDILDTPVSPELLPPSENGEILQQTESIVGPYILHDFYLYHFLRYGASPEKVKYLAINTFKDGYDEKTIDKWLTFFIKRFFSQQFKRSCIPDGPKVGTISISPRGDLRMPSDASSADWLYK